MKQIRWLGHAGFKIQFSDPTTPDVTRTIYVDTWLEGNPKLPADLKGVIPDDADLVLVTHGHFDHSSSAPALIKNSKKPSPKLIANYEIS